MTDVEAHITTSPPKRNVFALFPGLILHPRSTFEYLREQGGLSWIWPLMLSAILIAVQLTVSISLKNEQFRQERFSQMQLSENERAHAQQIMGLTTNWGMTIGIPVVAVVVMHLILMLAHGSLFYLGNLALGGQGQFHPMLRMVVWARAVPLALQNLVTIVGMLTVGRTLDLGLSGLVSSPSRVLIPPLDIALWRSFLGSIHIYWVWTMFLAWMGTLVTARLSGIKSTIIVFAIWLLAVLLMLGTTAANISLVKSIGQSSLNQLGRH